jgi:hypothetical protein
LKATNMLVIVSDRPRNSGHRDILVVLVHQVVTMKHAVVVLE